MAAQRKASLRPSDFVDALPMPIDGEFTWKECRFEFFDYTKKSGEVVATTTAARVNYEDKQGQEFVQHYSVGDPQRVEPSKDGKSLMFLGETSALNRSSNFFLLMSNLESAGFDTDLIGDDFSALEGMVTHNIGMPEPTRSGLDRATPEEGRRVRVIPVPDEIISMPGGKRAKATKKASGESDVTTALEMLSGLVAAAGDKGVTRQKLASAAIKAKQAGVAQVAYELTDEQLTEAGYEVDDDGLITV